jgi:hypothetical protein
VSTRDAVIVQRSRDGRERRAAMTLRDDPCDNRRVESNRMPATWPRLAKMLGKRRSRQLDHTRRHAALAEDRTISNSFPKNVLGAQYVIELSLKHALMQVRIRCARHDSNVRPAA